MMTVEEAVAGRRSIRAFLPKPVPRELIERVLAIAGRAPSGSNVQPWRVWVGCKARCATRIVRECVARYDRPNEVSPREYNYYPVKWREPYLARRRGVRLGPLRHARHRPRGQGRDARPARAQLRLLRCAGRTDSSRSTATWRRAPGSNYGMFLQAIMVAARQFGLGDVPAGRRGSASTTSCSSAWASGLTRRSWRHGARLSGPGGRR